MTKQYVTLECARLLQKKGFPLEKVYKNNGDRPLFYDLPKEHPDWSQCDAWYYPTLWDVLFWLRMEYSLFIGVDYDECMNSYGWAIYRVGVGITPYAGVENKPETSIQAGIMNALELIKTEERNEHQR